MPKGNRKYKVRHSITVGGKKDRKVYEPGSVIELDDNQAAELSHALEMPKSKSAAEETGEAGEGQQQQG